MFGQLNPLSFSVAKHFSLLDQRAMKMRRSVAWIWIVVLMFTYSQQQGICNVVRIMVFSSKTWLYTKIVGLFSNLFLGFNLLSFLHEGYTVHKMSMWCSSIQFPFNKAIGNSTLTNFLIACYEIWSNDQRRILNLNGT